MCHGPSGRDREITMSATASTMLELGTTAPDFSLPDVVSGKSVSLAEDALLVSRRKKAGAL